MDQQLQDYVAAQRHNGHSDEDIKNQLRNAGWGESDIESAFTPAPIPTPHQDTPPPLPESGHSNSDKLGKMRGAREIMADALEIYRHRLGTFILFLIFPAIVFGALFAAWFLLLALFGLVGGTSTSQQYGLPIIAITIICVLAFVVLNIPIIPAEIYNLAQPENIGFKRSYAAGWKFLKSYLWLMVLLFFVLFGGFIMLIVPGILMLVWLSQWSFALVIDNEHGLSALTRSREYVRGRWGATAWRLAFFSLLVYLVQLVIRSVPGALALPLDFIVSVFAGSFGIIYLYAVYKELRRTYVPTEKPVSGTFFKISAFVAIGVIAAFFIAFPWISSYFNNLFASLPSSSPSVSTNFYPTATPSSAPTPTPTISPLIGQTKTYSNAKYGYSLKYPSDWQVNTQYANDNFSADTTGGYSVASRLSIFPSSTSDQRDWLDFQIIKPTGSVNNYINSYIQRSNLSRSDVTINGHPAVFVQENQTSADGHQAVAVFIPNGNIIYYFQSFNPNTISIATTFNFQ